MVVVVAGLMLATSRLLYQRFEWLYRTSAGMIVVTAGVYVSAIHADSDRDNWGKALGTLGILTVLAWFLVPVLGRTSAGPRGNAWWAGAGPGRVEVELAEGETLIVRSS